MGKYKTMQDVIEHVFPESNPKKFEEYLKKVNRDKKINDRFQRKLQMYCKHQYIKENWVEDGYTIETITKCSKCGYIKKHWCYGIDYKKPTLYEKIADILKGSK